METLIALLPDLKAGLYAVLGWLMANLRNPPTFTALWTSLGATVKWGLLLLPLPASVRAWLEADSATPPKEGDGA